VLKASRSLGNRCAWAVPVAIAATALAACVPQQSGPVSTSPANPLNVAVQIGPPADVRLQQDGVALVSENGIVTQIPVRSSRDGSRVTLSNVNGQQICDLDLRSLPSSACFGTVLNEPRAFPLSLMGTSSRPFVFVGRLRSEPIVFFVGTDGIQPNDLCWRFTTTISSAAQELAQRACPNDPVRIAAPIEGTRISFSGGGTLDVRQAREGRSRYTISVNGTEQSVQDGFLGIVPSFASLRSCFRDADLGVPRRPTEHTCTRAAGGGGGGAQHTFTMTSARAASQLGGAYNSHDILAVNIRQLGMMGNNHASEHRFSVWRGAGVPLDYSRSLTRGYFSDRSAINDLRVVSVAFPGP
jgi:hypothetical protein